MKMSDNLHVIICHMAYVVVKELIPVNTIGIKSGKFVEKLIPENGSFINGTYSFYQKCFNRNYGTGARALYRDKNSVDGVVKCENSQTCYGSLLLCPKL